MNIFSDIDECLASPCKNGGECDNLINGFLCRCRPEYLGVTCDVYNEAYGRRTGVVWTVVTVAVLVILILVILAISLPITLRRMRTLAAGDEGECSEASDKQDTIPERKSRIFLIPGLFRKNNKTMKRPIFFTVKRSSSFEMKVNGGLSFNDLKVMEPEPVISEKQTHEIVAENEKRSLPNESLSGGKNWYLARVMSADGTNLMSHANSDHVSPGAMISGDFALSDSSVVGTTDSGPHVTQLYVDE